MEQGDAWQQVERRLEELAAADRFSGVVLVTRGAETLLTCGAGVADRAAGTPVTLRTRFAVASLSKMFTAAAVLSCVRDGLLHPHDRVVDLLPAARRPRTMRDAVTVHHLLTHTSGIGDYAEEDEDLPGYVADYGSLWRERPSYAMERPDDYLPLYADAAPVAEPGTAFHYCNGAYVLLGAVLEEVTGLDVVTVITQRVLVPVGMADSGYLRLDDAHPDVALAYLPRTDPSAPWRTNVFSVPVVGGGDGGALVTAPDVDRFLRAIAGGDLLGEELTATMRTPYVRVDHEAAMGYGIFLLDEGGFGHGGGDPGVETGARHLPDQDVSIVVLCNGEDMLDEAWDLVEAALATA
ncbi:serine hydrolase domain-containing protein [Nocardioides euryhalodurans]|uniref:Class A beta-lactamase-related serine hydrolase n=1 Tax=Nocardioides euryhalodurans TaxID=2518370 RepID=A0A4P7GK40_9ACTN|nr:serine hydrolase domain-containing protein [Nocardioides euryhalodurans]QBR92418.1 class A beta-lactamase-related serine hydrolase [Nocardioides euryhalodurans]